jgi:NHL repeat
MNNNRVARVLCMTLALAGCGGSGSSSTTGTGGNAQTYSLSGTIIGVNTGASLVLAVNGTQVTVSGGATTAALVAGLAAGTAYSVTVTTAPTGESCSVVNGTGTITSANVGNVVVTCTTTTGSGGSPQTYSLSGTVSGVNSGTLVLAVNGAQVTVAEGATTVALASGLAAGAAYTVTVTTAPTGETCSVVNGTGTITSANEGNVVVTCSGQAYPLGGTIAGLTQSGLVLANGSSFLPVSAGATSFTLPAVAYSSGYAVSVLTQPQGLACSVSNGSGMMPAAPVTSVAISCTNQPFSVGGAIAGLGGAAGLVLTNGTDSLTVSAGATTFVMPTKVAFGSNYAVQAKNSPAGLTCSVANGSGTMGAANVTQVAVTCSNQSNVLSGSITGLSQSGLILANGSDTLTVSAGSPGFSLSAVAVGASYNVLVQANPTGETCSVSDGTGTMPAGAVTDIAVTCSANTYTVGGVVSGLTRPGLVLMDNSGDPTSVAINATQFTMQTGLAVGASYDVTVAQQPYGILLACNPINASGSATSDVTSIAIQCNVSSNPNIFAVAGPFFNPTSAATDPAGNVFFVDTVSGDLRKILHGPQFPGNYGGYERIGGGFIDASSVAVDAADNVFVLLPSLGIVEEIPYSNVNNIYGNPITVVVGVQGAFGIAVDAADDVFVAQTLSNAVLEFPAANYGTGIPIGPGFTFNQPYGVAVDAAGDVFVADTNNNAIEEFSYNGSSYATTPVVLGSGFNGPKGVAVDGTGDVFVGDSGNNAIKELTYGQGNYATTPVVLDPAFTDSFSVTVDGTGDVVAVSINGAMEAIPYGQSGYSAPVALAYGLRNPQGLAIDAAGDLLIAAAGSATVVKISNGQTGYGAPVSLASQGSFVLPHGVAVDAAGNVFVVDAYENSVTKIPYSNGTYGSPVSLGSGFQFINPQGIAVDSAGNVFVADTGNNAIEAIFFDSTQGGYQTPVTIGSGFNQPMGVWVDAEDYVFVADTGNNAIKVIPYVSAFGGSAGAPVTLGSGFVSPQGVVTDALGNIFVADTGSNSIKEIPNENYGFSPRTLQASLSAPIAVSVDANGRVYVVDANAVWEFTPQ